MIKLEDNIILKYMAYQTLYTFVCITNKIDLLTD